MQNYDISRNFTTISRNFSTENGQGQVRVGLRLGQGQGRVELRQWNNHNNNSNNNNVCFLFSIYIFYSYKSPFLACLLTSNFSRSSFNHNHNIETWQALYNDSRQRASQVSATQQHSVYSWINPFKNMYFNLGT